jgi:hypothetical protein
MKEEKCRRCGMPLPRGSGRYLMVLTFIADVDFELEPLERNIEAAITQVLEEIENTPEGELMNQVYHKMVFLICRPCKETLAADPFTAPPACLSDSIQ